MKHDESAIKHEEHRSMEGKKSNRPDIRVSVCAEEAIDLFEWCQNDKNILIRAGPDWNPAEDLPKRTEALITLEAAWASEYKARNESREEWKVASSQARKMRSELLSHVYFPFYSIPDASAKARRISRDRTNAGLIQSLFELAELVITTRTIYSV